MDEPGVRTIVGVPVRFADRSEVVDALARPIDGLSSFLAAGMVITELGTEDVMVLDVYERDVGLRRAFEAASPYSTLTLEDLEAIDQHTLCLYLVDEHGGSIESAQRMVRFVQGILDRGGLAAKVESAGKAHSRADWAAVAANPDAIRLLVDTFMVMAGDADGAYTCGMHNLGMPDAETPDASDLAVAGNLLWQFCLYVAGERPLLESGQTFSLDLDSPLYRLEHVVDTRFASDDPFHNPFGTWRLLPA